MLIKDKEKYVGSLIKLWNEVFGDEEEYIKLFFKEAYYDGECFAETDGDEVVSAFYLLKCSIKCRGKIYRGRYLYAAATLPRYRGRGLMGKLIKEAQDYIKTEGLDYIALVPATDSLYDYYGKFAFKESMYKYRLVTDKKIATLRVFGEITDPSEFHRIRSSADCDMLLYNEVGNRYAFECLKFVGNRFFAVDDSSCYIENEEFFSSKSDFKDSADMLIGSLIGTEELFTNCALDGAQKIRNGMIYTPYKNMEFKDIYMNIALD